MTSLQNVPHGRPFTLDFIDEREINKIVKYLMVSRQEHYRKEVFISNESNKIERVIMVIQLTKDGDPLISYEPIK